MSTRELAPYAAHDALALSERVRALQEAGADERQPALTAMPR